jgi:hypothetical protein
MPPTRAHLPGLEKIGENGLNSRRQLMTLVVLELGMRLGLVCAAKPAKKG